MALAAPACSGKVSGMSRVGEECLARSYCTREM
jgi:hypothetical protein